MKHQIATDPSQSARLLACGVDPNSADMSYTSAKDGCLSTIPYERQCMPSKQPAWSLSALLALLPRQINDYELEYRLVLSPSQYSKGWIIEYIDEGANSTLHSFRGFSLVDGCVLMIEYLTANGYTLNTN